jgi:bud emergence protein 1
MDNGMLPHVEDWKKKALNYRANCITLGILDNSAQTSSASHPSTFINTIPPTTHPPMTMQMASTQSYNEQQLSDLPQTPPILPGLLLSAKVISFHFEMDEYWFRIHALYQPVNPSGSTMLPPAKHFTLFHMYNDFFNYQIALLDMFPREAGHMGRHPRIIPEVDRALSTARQWELDDYLHHLCYST